ncbi:MAG: hypothetical protein AABW59_00255 [archaeon]
MARHKEKEFKDFLISERRKIGPGLTNTPVWIMQKAGKRIWNKTGKRTWKTIDLGARFPAHKAAMSKILIRSGDHKSKVPKRKRRTN